MVYREVMVNETIVLPRERASLNEQRCSQNMHQSTHFSFPHHSIDVFDFSINDTNLSSV